MSAAEHDHRTHEEWWAGLSLEERFSAIEMIRLDQDPDHQHDTRSTGRPTGERAAWVRRRPEYLERFAAADNIARQDDPGFGPDPVPGSHEHTQPLADE